MRIYDLMSKDGSSRAFEVQNVLLSRRRACLVAESIPGSNIVRRHRLFRDTDDFCEFTVDGYTFVIEEPFGDNSRYWIGATGETTSAAVEKVRAAFRAHNPIFSVLRFACLLLVLLAGWQAQSRFSAFLAQDRCLDSGGAWTSASQACIHGNTR